MKKNLFIVVMCLMAMSANAQEKLTGVPGFEPLEGVKVTDVGVLTTRIDETLEIDSLTGYQDTTYQVVPEVTWLSSVSNGKKPSLSNLTALAPLTPTKWEGDLHAVFKSITFYVFKFTYPSINHKGEVITLSGMAAAPDPSKTSEVKNLLIGTHATIASNRECPSEQTKFDGASDWGIMFSTASSNSTELTWYARLGKNALRFLKGPLNWLTETVKEFADDIKYKNYRYNFVVMPDYEGYGETKNDAHPYLYQELTARQVIDGVRAALTAYNNDPSLKSIRRDFRKDYRTAICGYSQGGAVAMATQRFIEQNHLDEEMRLTGSICGDGPYDLMSTLMYYTKNDLEGKSMSMPVVLPLIVKGMMDSNPYMRAHKASEYFQPWFVETGILDWIASKEKSTGDIETYFQNLHKNGKDGNKDYYKNLIDANGNSKMRDIMNAECYAYFKKVYEDNKDNYKTAVGIPWPAKRGVMEDLHMALASNDMTEGWTPKHHILLFHSNADTAVPYDNAERAVAKFGKWAVLHLADMKHDHSASGVDFFSGDSKIIDVAYEESLRLSTALLKILKQPVVGQKAGDVKGW